tara:strand:- start:8151 stop:8846 length:696 start_codon:yes stop_codon:yes gene_type:complete
MLNAIAKHFPEAILIHDLETKILNGLKDNSIKSEKSIWGTSLCSDEVSNMFGELNKNFAGPGPFVLGGISGIPFAGKTGLNAFLSHVPKGGAAVILYGPHIGLSKDGKLGTVKRENLNQSTPCCGSLVAGLDMITKNEIPSPLDPLDYQQSRVCQNLYVHRDEILNAEFPLKEATVFTYERINNKLHSLIEASKNSFSDIVIYTVGGIVLNTDWDIEDYFQVRNKEVIEFI